MKLLLRLIVYLMIIGVFTHLADARQGGSFRSKSASIQSVDQAINNRDADRKIKEAYGAVQSDFWVQSQGTVVKILKDDNDGARHQRFLLKLSNGHVILIAHNIDLAPKVEGLAPGDVVGFSGEYEWNHKGGVVHWTHHDPSGRKTGGWLMHNGKKYE